jgi:microcystin-dependent protein
VAWYNWSRTANANDSSDTTINMREGMAPSAVNDGIRALMAATASWRDDTAGATVTSGTANVYTLSTYSAFDTLPHLSGQMIAFTPHATNTAATTLAVDGLAAKPVRLSPNVEIPAGVLIAGTPYLALYNNSDGAFYLHGVAAAQAYAIPVGSGMDYWGTTAPSSVFAFACGQGISRTTYSVLFGLMGTTFGTGDGSTTFNLPDKRGRVTATADNMGGTAASRSPFNFAGAGGESVHALTQGELPAVALSVSASGSASVSSTVAVAIAGNLTNMIMDGTNRGYNNVPVNMSLGGIGSTGSASVSGSTSPMGSGGSHNNMQPTIAANYIIKIA